MAKRRGNNEGSIVKRPNGKYRAQVSIDGKRLSFTGATQKECQAWIRKTRDEMDKGLTYSGAIMKLSAYMEKWLLTVRENRREKTYIQYTDINRRYINPRFGETPLQNLRPLDIETYLTELQKNGLGARTCQIIYAVLHVALHVAVKKGLIGRNPMDAVEKPKNQQPAPKKVLNQEQVQQFLIAAEGERLEMLYYLAVVTGMREGELLGLKWSDLDWRKGYLKVSRQVQRVPRKGLVFSLPKTNSGLRTIAVGKGTIDRLKQHQNRQELEKAVAGKRWVENDLIFPSSIGTPMDPRNMLEAFKKVLENAGLADMRFHDLRHTSITLILNSLRVPIKEAQHRAGHASPTTTINIYGGETTTIADEQVAQDLDDLVTPVRFDLPQKPVKKKETANPAK